eukprot:s2212_g12.t1
MPIDWFNLCFFRLLMVGSSRANIRPRRALGPEGMSNSDQLVERLQESERIQEVHEWLGTGSFSNVFRCQVMGIEDQVAVKVLKQKDMLPGRGREALFIEGLRHPNLVNVLGIVEEDAMHYVILELCTGGSLQDVIHEEEEDLWQQMPAMERLRAGYDIALALDYIHQQDILHRDIKSGNAFLHTPIVPGCGVPTVKVGDMGFARPLSEFDGMTQGVGTLRYMAPEVLNSGEYGVSADIFSFGILLHEMLSGNIPFRGKNEAALCLAIMRGQRPPFEELLEIGHIGEEKLHQVWAILQVISRSALYPHRGRSVYVLLVTWEIDL